MKSFSKLVNRSRNSVNLLIVLLHIVSEISRRRSGRSPSIRGMDYLYLDFDLCFLDLRYSLCKPRISSSRLSYSRLRRRGLTLARTYDVMIGTAIVEST